MVVLLSTGLFDSIQGLPLHPLIVHFAVVLLPLAALALIIEAIVPRWADRYATLTVGVLAVGTLAAFVAKESGESLARHVGQPGTHGQWGDVLPPLAGVLLIIAAAWWWLRRSRATSVLRRVVALAMTILSLAVTVVTVVVGHTGAQAAWAGVVTTPVPSASASSTPHASSGAPTSASTTSGKAYTLQDVSRHNGVSSCWTAIDGKVYDLTAWINQHPGGAQAIQRLCGTDGTQAFNAQHGGQARPAEELRRFLIGTLR